MAGLLSFGLSLSEEPARGLIEWQASVSDSDCVPSFHAP